MAQEEKLQIWLLRCHHLKYGRKGQNEYKKNKQKNAKAKMVQEINCGSLGLLTNVAKPSCEIGPLRSDGHKNFSILSDTIFEYFLSQLLHCFKWHQLKHEIDSFIKSKKARKKHRCVQFKVWKKQILIYCKILSFSAFVFLARNDGQVFPQLNDFL